MNAHEFTAVLDQDIAHVAGDIARREANGYDTSDQAARLEKLKGNRQLAATIAAQK
jgi:hypothetical protein